MNYNKLLKYSLIFYKFAQELSAQEKIRDNILKMIHPTFDKMEEYNYNPVLAPLRKWNIAGWDVSKPVDLWQRFEVWLDSYIEGNDIIELFPFELIYVNDEGEMDSMIRTLSSKYDEGFVNQISLRGTNPDVVDWALQQLLSNSYWADKYLTNFVKSKNNDVRYDVAHYISRKKEWAERYLPFLITDKDPRVRRAALFLQNVDRDLFKEVLEQNIELLINDPLVSSRVFVISNMNEDQIRQYGDRLANSEIPDVRAVLMNRVRILQLKDLVERYGSVMINDDEPLVEYEAVEALRQYDDLAEKYGVGHDNMVMEY
jgi:hypothetical protein